MRSPNTVNQFAMHIYYTICTWKLQLKWLSPNFGKYFSLCSSVPYWLMGCITSEDWTLMADRYPLSTLSHSLHLGYKWTAKDLLIHYLTQRWSRYTLLTLFTSWTLTLVISAMALHSNMSVTFSWDWMQCAFQSKRIQPTLLNLDTLVPLIIGRIRRTNCFDRM